MAIYISGDPHGNFRRFFSKAYFSEMETLTKEDLLIICGDFGGVWDESSETERKLLDELNNVLNCSIAFCDGNHENHSLLDALPVAEFHGGYAHQIRESVFHLMRGQVYIYDNVKIFVMGGGSSHDKKFRKENVTWWARELPSAEEYEEARRNLLKHRNKVDLIISHVAPSSLQEKIWGWRECYPRDSLTDFLEEIFRTVTF